ncbi:YiiX/YebB-like N1pC/P60 family cysteine hydrolase [Candidatus Latescibacterota bacterium]
MKYYHLRRIFVISICLIVFLYTILLIPESSPSLTERSLNQPFIWDQDPLWNALEGRFINARQTGCDQLSDPINESLLAINNLLKVISFDSLQPDSQKFSDIEDALFSLAPLIAACQHRQADYIDLFSRLRHIVKTQSIHWDMDTVEARQTLYRLLYGGRAAIEEVMLQASQETIPPRVMGHEEPSKTPYANILGVTIHSGDILVSRGGAPTSALIARGNDYPGNFSHVALVHIDEKMHLVSIIEAHIECGVKIATLDEYLKDKKLRVMILRLRSDLPQLIIDPMIPHKAATSALTEAVINHIPYDFEMNYQDNTKFFCSEVASAPYQNLGVNLWMGISSISSPGVARWLSLFGVKYFETQEPSDLEYDPQLSVIAEWRDPETLFKDHIDNAVIEVMLESAESGKDINYSWFMLPIARIAKFYSSLLNVFGLVGPIPEGMSATAALRIQRLTDDHNAIKDRVESMAIEFKKQNNYTSPYWQLLNFTRKAMIELNY